MKSRDLVLVAILLAIGAILSAFTPNIGIITPDTVVTMAALALLLVRPRWTTGFGIGIIAGVISMMFSKSAIAWFNIPTHALGALAAALVVQIKSDLPTGPILWKAALTALAYGVVSGGLFITAMLVVGLFPFEIYITVAWLQVLLSTLSSIIICLLLYKPAKRFRERYFG